MTSMTRQYSAAASRARTAVDKTADFWTQSTQTVTDRLSGLPRVDLVPAVERYFNLVQRTVDINRQLAVRWAEAAGTLSGAAREKAGSAGDVMQDKADAVGNAARKQAKQAEQAAREQASRAEQAEKELALRSRRAAREQAKQAEQAAHKQTAKAERAENELARQARQAEREHASQAHKRARVRYEGLTKAELSDLLAQRKLPKTGNIDELIERLVAADSK
jgi:hypothetical protein